MNQLIVTVNIRSLAVGGEFVGQVIETEDLEDKSLLGITVFVPFAIPGETCRVRITEKKERYLKGDLVEVLSSSEKRVSPGCPYFTDCGGCELQHVSYESQLEIKYQMIVGAFRAGRISGNVMEKVEKVRSGEPYSFRRRIHLHIDSNGRLGFYKTKSRTIVGIDSCPISVPEINNQIENAREIAPAIKGKINSLVLESDGKQVLAVLSSPFVLSSKDLKEVLDATKKKFKNYLILGEGKELAGNGMSHLELPLNKNNSLFLRFPGGAFSQINWPVNLDLIENVVSCISPNVNDLVYDLYAGAGNFTLPLARAGANVHAVESDNRLTYYGKESARVAGLSKKINYHNMTVEKFLKKNSSFPDNATILADPPRSGLGSLCENFSSAKSLIYISCHLPSLVRDLKMLLDKGFNAEFVRPFDMFGQTSYLETLTYLRR